MSDLRDIADILHSRICHNILLCTLHLARCTQYTILHTHALHATGKFVEKTYFLYGFSTYVCHSSLIFTETHSLRHTVDVSACRRTCKILHITCNIIKISRARVGTILLLLTTTVILNIVIYT
jgi:hypothetical protein